MEWAKIFFDLVKGTAWPFSVMFIVWLFRIEIRERIKDIVSVGPTGAVLQPPSQTQVKPPTGLSKPATHPLTTVQALIKTIEGQVSEMPEDERLPKLISQLAEAQIERGFEFVWGAIFGSQITLLRKLREAGSMPAEDMKRFYEEEVRTTFREAFAEMHFDQWFVFLRNQQLVTPVEPDRFMLTDYGRDFLSFVDVRKSGVSRAL
ncbi:hypothetical protein ACRYWZ_04615 [Agrobacterium deltaense]|uniref:hypothetical protein n=1 Tax=Agrobacterium deltaense TaxID=1183412 RepID=UPI003D98C1A6